MNQYDFREVIPLSNCWFCGHDNMKMNSRVTSGMALLNNTKSKFYAYCPKCHAKGPMKKTPEEATLAWNAVRVDNNGNVY